MKEKNKNKQRTRKILSPNSSSNIISFNITHNSTKRNSQTLSCFSLKVVSCHKRAYSSFKSKIIYKRILISQIQTKLITILWMIMKDLVKLI